MFDFGVGWSELLLVCVVALIVIGPKELPGALRTLGQWMAKIRRMAAEFQGQFQEAMREAEVDQLRKDMDDMAAKAYTHFDPLEDVRKDIERTISDQPAANQPPAHPPEVATAPPAPDTPAVTLPAPSVEPAADQSVAAPASPRPDVPPAQVASTVPDATSHTPEQAAQPEPALAGAKPDPGRSPA